MRVLLFGGDRFGDGAEPERHGLPAWMVAQ
jgi:hypothetical protein